MSLGRMAFFGVWCVGVAIASAWAQEPAPAAGSIPSNFRGFIAVDDRYPPKVTPVKKAEDRDPRDRTLKMHDLVVENGLNPVVAIFTRTEPKAGIPAETLAKGLNPLVDKYKNNNFATFVVFIRLEKEYPFDDRYVGGDPKMGFVREKEATVLRAYADASATPRVPLGLAAGKLEQTAAWGIKDESETVVILYNRMKVIHRWEFAAGATPSAEELQKIIDAATKEAAGS